MSIPYRDFDINDLDTPKPWAPRETQAWKDVLDTMLGDTLTGLKEVAGHKHNKIYSPIGVAGIEIGAAGDAQVLNFTTVGVVTNQATGSLETVPILPINFGGTNSDAALNNDRAMISNGGKIVESVITVAELALLDGMTAVQDGVSPSTVFVTKSYVDEAVAGTDTFLELTDTPSGYSGQGGKLLAVNTTPDGIEFITNNSAQWDTAYTHSQIVTGNPHAIAFDDLNGNPSDVITAGTNISWSGDTLNVIGVGSSTFLGLTDTPGSFVANRVLFESGSAVTHSDLITWDNANEILQIQNTDTSTAGSTFRFRKSRGGGNIVAGDRTGAIVWESREGGSWVEQAKIEAGDVAAPSSPDINMWIGSTQFLKVYDSFKVYPSDSAIVVYPSDGGVGFGTISPFAVAGGDISSTYNGVKIDGKTQFGILTIEGTGAGANGSFEADQSANLVLAMKNTPEAGHSVIGAEIAYGGDFLTIRGLEDSYTRLDPTVVFDLINKSVRLTKGGAIDEFSADATLAGNSDLAVPTEHAVKTYIDSAVSGTWTNWSASANPGGWVSTPTIDVYYKKVGKLVFVKFYISGTSNATNAQFELPFNSSSGETRFCCQGMNNSSNLTGGASGTVNFSAISRCELQPDQGTSLNLTGWTSSGNKRVRGSFWYESA